MYGDRCIEALVVTYIYSVTLAWQPSQEQGIGRHTYDEIVRIGMPGWRALAELLDDRIYLLGDVPSTLDATGLRGYIAFSVIPLTAQSVPTSPEKSGSSPITTVSGNGGGCARKIGGGGRRLLSRPSPFRHGPQ